MPGSGTGTSRRRRRHREMFRFSAVRTTHAAGAGCLLSVRQGGTGPGESLGDKLLSAVLVTDDDQDRAQAVVPETPVELREVQALGSHAYSTRNRRPRDYSARPGNPGREKADAETVTLLQLSQGLSRPNRVSTSWGTGRHPHEE